MIATVLTLKMDTRRSVEHVSGLYEAYEQSHRDPGRRRSRIGAIKLRCQKTSMKWTDVVMERLQGHSGGDGQHVKACVTPFLASS